MAATLAQIIAVEEGVRSATERWWKLVAGELAKGQLLVGHSYVHEAFEGARTQEPDKMNVRLVTEQLLGEAREKLGRFYDVSATRDWANLGATADVVLEDGTVILTGVPTTFLLFLEKRLAALLADVRALPAQDPAADWHPSTVPGVWRTEPVLRATTRKDTEFKVVSPAEGMRPAQYEAINRDVPDGQWTRVEMTSAMPYRDLSAIADRLTLLIEAVKKARIHANRIDAPDQHVSRAIFGYVFGE